MWKENIADITHHWALWPKGSGQLQFPRSIREMYHLWQPAALPLRHLKNPLIGCDFLQPFQNVPKLIDPPFNYYSSPILPHIQHSWLLAFSVPSLLSLSSLCFLFSTSHPWYFLLRALSAQSNQLLHEDKDSSWHILETNTFCLFLILCIPFNVRCLAVSQRAIFHPCILFVNMVVTLAWYHHHPHNS